MRLLPGRGAPRRWLSVALAGLLAAGVAVGATPAAHASSPAGPAFGVQFHGMWSSYTDAQRATALDEIAASGAGWVRLDVSWAMLQPTSRGAYDMQWGVPFVDRVVNMAAARGLKVLVTLFLTPGWANGGADPHTLPTDPADYAAVARWAAARYAGKVQAWEVWNEPNTSFMTGSDPVAYTKLLQAAYPAFHAGDPTTTVVFGGPSYNDVSWIRRAYQAGAQGYFDVLATHPYMGVADAPPETPDDGTEWTMTHVAAVHQLMTQFGDGAKPIWFTEFGWSTHSNAGIDMSSSSTNWARGVTEQTAGDYLVRTLRMCATSFPYVTNVFWYTDRDQPLPSSPTLGDIQNDNYGLLRADLTPKPAWQAVHDYLVGSSSPSPSPSPTPTGTPSGTPSGTPTPSTSPSPTGTPTPTPSATDSPTSTPSVTPSTTPSTTPTPTVTPSTSPTPTVTPAPTVTPTPSTSPSPTPSPTSTTSVPSHTHVHKAPARPLLMTATSTRHGILLRWRTRRGYPPAAYYRVLRSRHAHGHFALVATTSWKRFRDHHLVRGRTYYYRVRAVGRLGHRSHLSRLRRASTA